jgi:hypothetical protein
MNNLKILAACLVIVFIGLFVFDSTKKKSGRDVASIDEPVKKKVVKSLTKGPKVIPPSEKNMALETSTKETIPEPKGLKEGEFPVYKGRFVARIHNGKLHPVYKGSTKDLLFSKESAHPDLDNRAAKFFKALGFNSDKKMKVQRGKSYFMVSGEDAVKVDEFKVSYNWNGKPKKAAFLMRSTSGRYYRKLRDL